MKEAIHIIDISIDSARSVFQLLFCLCDEGKDTGSETRYQLTRFFPKLFLNEQENDLTMMSK